MHTAHRFLIAACAVLVLTAVPSALELTAAFAQVVQQPTPITNPNVVTIDLSMFSGFGRTMMEGVWAILVPAVIGWVAYLIQKYTGVNVRARLLDIEANHRQAYQTALANAAGALMMRVGTDGKVNIDVKNKAIADVTNMVIRSVPDAINYFGISPQSIAEKILAKIPIIQAPDATSMEKVTAPPMSTSPANPAPSGTDASGAPPPKTSGLG